MEEPTYFDDYDVDDELDVDEDFFDSPFVDDFSYEFQGCVYDSISQISMFVMTLLGLTLICRIAWTCTHHLLSNAEWLQHLISMMLGLTVLYILIGYEFLYVLFLSLIALALILIVEYCNYRNIGIIIAIVTISFHFVYEALCNQPEMWHRIRGIVMIATMKIISLAFDLESSILKEKKTSLPALIPYLGYIFCPATCLLGPWIPYSAYVQSIRKDYLGGKWALWSVLNAFLAVIFCSLSDCIVPMTHFNWKILNTYRDALSFRCSHYFISFLSQATLSANGIKLNRTDKIAPNPLFGHMVTKPWHIEFPLSITSLVRSWNIPMHDWLKTYIFHTTLNRFGNYLIALLCTYIVSSLLHGLDIRIYLVLLSLAFSAYVEKLMRAKLATIFDACIDTNSCRKPCKFSYCPSHGWYRTSSWIVFLINVIFSLLCVFHLAYFGVMMNITFESGTKFTLSDSLMKWSQLNYLSHWITFGTYISYHLI